MNQRWSTAVGLITGGASTGLASEGGAVFGGLRGKDADGGIELEVVY